MNEKRTIVPTTRLLFWTGAVVTPFSGVAALAPAFIPVSFGIMGLLLLLAFWDILLSRRMLNRIRVTAPGVCRLSIGRKNNLRLMIANDAGSPLSVHLGLPLVSGIRTDPLTQWIDLKAEPGFLPVDWSIDGLKQGRYPIRRCHLEISSRLGFWMMRRDYHLDIEIRVYPSLWENRKQMALYFSGHGSGAHRQRQVGKGREFDQLREYFPGDSYEDIHWKATAKRQQPITRVYQVERTQHLYVVIDASRLSARRADLFSAQSPAGPEAPFAPTLLDRFISAALVLGMAAERQGDRFGLLVFDDRVRVFLKARTGRLHFKTVRDSLFTLAPRRVSPDFTELFTYIGNHVRRRALMIFLTSLDDPVLAEGFSEHVHIIGRRHLTLVQMMKPKLAKPLFSDPSINETDDLYSQLGGHFLWTSLRERARILNRMGIGMVLADYGEFSPAILSRYLSAKQRQVL